MLDIAVFVFSSSSWFILAVTTMLHFGRHQVHSTEVVRLQEVGKATYNNRYKYIMQNK